MKSPRPKSTQPNVPDDCHFSARKMQPRVTRPRVFLVKAEDSAGQNLDLFVAAHSRMSAPRHYEQWCRENSWVPHGKIEIFEVPTPHRVGPLEWKAMLPLDSV